MKVGDLCTCRWEDGFFVYLGEGYYRGWHHIISLNTGKKAQYQRQELLPVKKVYVLSDPES